jgi:hypothetical protein
MTRLILAIVCALTGSRTARAGVEYFVTVFAAETVPFRAKHTHTFVPVHRAPATGGAVETHSISWVPANMRPRGLTLRPEAGANLPLADTFAFCRQHCMRVSAWGPYKCDRELFELMKCQAAKLDGGTVKYKPTDNLYPSDVAANCYHAIWQPVAPCRKASGPFNCGDASGATTVQLFRKWLCDPCATHDDVLPLSVPKGETVVRRTFDDRPGRVDALRSAVR